MRRSVDNLALVEGRGSAVLANPQSEKCRSRTPRAEVNRAILWDVGTAELECSFCGLTRAGGVAGPTQSVYICPDCIRLANEVLAESERATPETP